MKKETWLFSRLSTGSTTLCSGDVFWPDHASLIPISLIKVIISAPKQWIPHCQFFHPVKVQEYFGVQYKAANFVFSE